MKIIIVGAGAAGMMAAIAARKQGKEVIILEQLSEPGKKIMATGNGKCNFSNLHISVDHYKTSDSDFVQNVLEHFSNKDAIRFFRDLGIIEKEKNGYFYPRSNQASSIRDALWNECFYQGVQIKLNCQILDIDFYDSKYWIKTKEGIISSECMIFACGLLAGTNLGSNGSAFQYIEKLGHSFKDIVPALVQMKSEQSIFKNLAGIRSDVNLELWNQDHLLFQDQGEIQLTNDGVSGIVSFQASLIASDLMNQKKDCYLMIDFVPFLKEKDLIQFLQLQFQRRNHMNHKSKMAGIIPEKLAAAFLLEEGIVPESKKSILPEQVELIAKKLKHFKVSIYGTRGFGECQVCLGGVPLEELESKTMMSKICPGLFFAGEIVDVAGQCGGYNLQWAWSSGYLAGLSAGKYLE